MRDDADRVLPLRSGPPGWARAAGWLGALTDLWNRLISGCWLISGPLAYPRRRPPPHLRPTRHPAPSPRVP